MFAIVDIETTGGYAANNGITEVAIVLHNGKEEEGRFSTLINPNQKIPIYITALTGITQSMVSNAPSFENLASNIHRLLANRVFVAHNVNFDYSFLKHHLQQAGLDLDCRKLCTVRLTRQVFPGLQSYSLGNLCRHFNIPIYQRHRAEGDAEATVKLFQHLMENGAQTFIENSLKRTKEQSLPPHLSKEQVDKLPYCPGVYYFHNEKGKVVYVGKAKNLKYRVSSHFTNNNATRQRQNFLRTIHSITYQRCGTELMAAILESVEIRRLWPEFNVSQKRFTQVYGLYAFEDRKGYMRLGIEKKKKNLPCVYTFGYYLEVYNQLRALVEKFDLDLRLCFIDKTPLTADMQRELPEPSAYNLKVQEAINYIKTQLPTFAVKDDGREPGEQSVILMEEGKFYGMGYVSHDTSISSASELKEILSAYPESDMIRNMISQYVQKFPAKRISFNK
jgi:DNA polymerase-3 subunit epsilon